MKTKILLTALILSIAINAWFYWPYASETKQHQSWQAQSERANADLMDIAIKYYNQVDITDELEQELIDTRKHIEDFQSVSGFEYIGVCEITAYCCEKRPHICGEGHGITSSGLPVQPGMVAVDKNVIPLGSTVYIDGVPYLAADTGGKTKGKKIDIAVQTHTEAVAYTMQYHDVWIVRK